MDRFEPSQQESSNKVTTIAKKQYPDLKEVTTKNIDNSKETLNDPNGLQKLLRLKSKDSPSAKLYLQLISSISNARFSNNAVILTGDGIKKDPQGNIIKNSNNYEFQISQGKQLTITIIKNRVLQNLDSSVNHYETHLIFDINGNIYSESPQNSIKTDLDTPDGSLVLKDILKLFNKSNTIRNRKDLNDLRKNLSNNDNADDYLQKNIPQYI